MLNNITGFDHVGIDPEDIWEAFKQFTRLGFTVSTPSRFQGIPVESCQVTFEGMFLSISNTFVDGDNPDTEWIARTKPIGITELMLGTTNLQQLKSELQKSHSELVEGHVDVEVNRRLYLDNKVLEQRFLIYVLSPEMIEGVGTIGFCEHGTAELVWRPELLRHANTAMAISSLTFLYPQPASLQAVYNALLGDKTVSISEERYAIKLSNVVINFVTETAIQQQLPEYVEWSELRNKDLKIITFNVADITVTVDYFDFMGVSYFCSGETIFVHPGEACGFLLGFKN